MVQPVVETKRRSSTFTKATARVEIVDGPIGVDIEGSVISGAPSKEIGNETATSTKAGQLRPTPKFHADAQVTSEAKEEEEEEEYGYNVESFVGDAEKITSGGAKFAFGEVKDIKFGETLREKEVGQPRSVAVKGKMATKMDKLTTEVRNMRRSRKADDEGKGDDAEKIEKSSLMRQAEGGKSGDGKKTEQT